MAGDVVSMIKADHRLMERLLEKMRSDKKQRPALVRECVARLSAHSWAEEERVYPALIHASPPEEGQVYHGVEEHHEAEQLLHQLQKADPQSAQFEAVLEEFVAAVKHHVEEEESEILPELAKSVERSRLEELGTAFEERRMAILIEHGISEAGAVGTAADGGEGAEPSREELYERAKQEDIPGRSKMSKEELEQVLAER
jgi:hemerythrin superfamily protein